MKEENKVAFALTLFIILAVGTWIGIVGYYVVSNIPPDEEVNEIKGLPIFLIGCALVVIFMIGKCSNNNKDEKSCNDR